MIVFRFLVSALMLVAANSATAQIGGFLGEKPWSKGDMQEIKPGRYAVLSDDIDGWKIWGMITKTRRNCTAIKQRDRGPQRKIIDGVYSYTYGVPFTHDSVIADETPMTIRLKNGRPNYEVEGSYTVTKSEWRRQGEMFFTAFKETSFEELEALDGQEIEIALDAYKYPNIREGYKNGGTTIDLTGISKIPNALNKCEADIKRK